MIRAKEMSLKHLVVQKQGNVVSDMGEEKVMLNIENGKYYNLGKVGGDVWELIKEKKLVSELINNIMSNYDIEREQCEKQILSFLENLHQEKLINIIESK